ncbi:MAG: Proline dehydrogenase [uncultured Nocardioidaceae bacterium]|uniref:proline dehydrogenase n=1 Tax=uncultured Nocardioidaceae bacterium TaxID=253824 RepID=A0A6J4MMI6_9ACTN|nr:MAG: Proline dehydrogenase [uncultured Nocardioidaceae bacterium]
MLLRHSLLALSRSDRVKQLITTTPVSSNVVGRYVPGESTREAVDVVEQLVAAGNTVSLDFLGEDTLERAHADDTVTAYLDVLEALSARGLAPSAEVSVKLSAVGQALPDGGERVALDNARRICHAARAAGTVVSLDMEDHTTTDSTLRVLRELRQDFPETGAVLQAYLHRTEADCRELATAGSRVRLCKGAYNEPESVAYQSRLDVDRSFVRCLRILMEGDGYPMVASHDPNMVAIATALVRRTGRSEDTYEFQMLYGIRPDEQQRLVEEGHRVRVYVPYGQEWYGYLMRRLAERPSNLSFFLRSLVSTK